MTPRIFTTFYIKSLNIIFLLGHPVYLLLSIFKVWIFFSFWDTLHIYFSILNSEYYFSEQRFCRTLKNTTQGLSLEYPLPKTKKRKSHTTEDFESNLLSRTHSYFRECFNASKYLYRLYYLFINKTLIEIVKINPFYLVQGSNTTKEWLETDVRTQQRFCPVSKEKVKGNIQLLISASV